MRKRTIIILGLALLVIAVGLTLVLGGAFQGGTVVDAVRVRLGDLEVTLPATGTFETSGVDLAFEIPGRLVEVHVGEGTVVKRGALLASLEASDLRALAEQAEAAA